MSQWNSFALTHTGKVRQVNEDAFINREQDGFWAVADGMGGHVAGDYASQQIVLGLSKINFNEKSIHEVANELDDTLTNIDAQLKEYATSQKFSAVGSTIAALYLTKDNLGLVYWVGDSRVYRYRDNELVQLSNDHSLVQELIDVGELTEAEAEFFPSKNIITRAVGANSNLCSEVVLINYQPDDLFLICSDGLINEVSDKEIHDVLSNLNISTEEKANELLEATLQTSAADNITFILTEII